MNKRVLVIGGAGYIGSHTCKELAEAGYEPVVFDDLSRGHRHNVKWGPFCHGSVSDKEALSSFIGRCRPDACLHFAASAYVGESFLCPEKYYENNVCGLVSLLAVLAEHRIAKLVFSSTCAVYGEPPMLPVTERCARNPISPYGRSKMMCEDILFDCAAASRSKCMILRYFNACGADPDGELSEDHDPETHIIPRCLMASAGLIPFVEIFGADHETPDGTCVRDYVHVKDLAIAHVSAVRKLEADEFAPVVNIGAGVGHSIKEILQMVETVSNQSVPTKISARRPGDPACLLSSISLAKSDWVLIRDSLI